jgi:hypothetical protein
VARHQAKVKGTSLHYLPEPCPCNIGVTQIFGIEWDSLIETQEMKVFWYCLAFGAPLHVLQRQ